MRAPRGPSGTASRPLRTVCQGSQVAGGRPPPISIPISADQSAHPTEQDMLGVDTHRYVQPDSTALHDTTRHDTTQSQRPGLGRYLPRCIVCQESHGYPTVHLSPKVYRTDRLKKRSCICWRACRVGVLADHRSFCLIYYYSVLQGCYLPRLHTRLTGVCLPTEGTVRGCMYRCSSSSSCPSTHDIHSCRRPVHYTQTPEPP